MKIVQVKAGGTFEEIAIATLRGAHVDFFAECG